MHEHHKAARPYIPHPLWPELQAEDRSDPSREHRRKSKVSAERW